MTDATADFASWLAQADIPQSRLTAEVAALLGAVFRFRQQQGTDYFSTRLLGHFLLHAGTGLKLAQIARLLGISRPTASRQQNLSSKQAIQQAHHRLDGRPYGKLLPRYAGAIAAFLVKSPAASRAELIAFVFDNFGVRVSRIALYKFLKKYGLDPIPSPATPQAKAVAAPSPEAQEQPPAPASCSVLVPVSVAAPPFSSRARNTPVPSC
jgi:transposase